MRVWYPVFLHSWISWYFPLIPGHLGYGIATFRALSGPRPVLPHGGALMWWGGHLPMRWGRWGQHFSWQVSGPGKQLGKWLDLRRDDWGLPWPRQSLRTGSDRPLWFMWQKCHHWSFHFSLENKRNMPLSSMVYGNHRVGASAFLLCHFLLQ